MIRAKKLSKMAKKWQRFTAIRCQRISFPGNSNHDGSDSCSTSSVVDKGHFVVYTSDQKRFVVPLAYLNNMVFRQLLKMSEEEYGLPSDGPIILPCDSLFMDYFICTVQQDRAGDLHNVFLNSVASCHCASSCSYEVQMNQQLLVR
ncbi:Auxin-responsive protein SAUR61 [Sesamum angolense]|uniref:Auxin-responsive protein SAUR61 n=1 Tax=Sesamum angolense TaxID=2727404 RepID=A0AAE1WXX3_9LAMI|nr:Auxin-responsive protein SAUR61 [Sesamum angolense]